MGTVLMVLAFCTDLFDMAFRRLSNPIGLQLLRLRLYKHAQVPWTTDQNRITFPRWIGMLGMAPILLSIYLYLAG